VASQFSPTPEIYRSIYGVSSYRQDLDYEPGVNGDRIGGDAADMPLPDGFATKMALHCSFEHFEGDSDIRFMRELNRVLRPGGAVCIVPFYIGDEYLFLCDPQVAYGTNVRFETGVPVYGTAGWGNRFGRIYDAAHVRSRLVPQIGELKAEVFRIGGAENVDPSCYVRYALVLKRPAAHSQYPQVA
jgi:SAM-dependent methyltransferase